MSRIPHFLYTEYDQDLFHNLKASLFNRAIPSITYIEEIDQVKDVLITLGIIVNTDRQAK